MLLLQLWLAGNYHSPRRPRRLTAPIIKSRLPERREVPTPRGKLVCPILESLRIVSLLCQRYGRMFTALSQSLAQSATKAALHTELLTIFSARFAML